MKSLFTALLCITAFSLSAQPYPQEITLANGSKMLWGTIDQQLLEKPPYASWFTKQMDNYTVDQSLVDLFKKKLRKHKALLFLGTWCGDSKREVPKLLKILEAANFPKTQLSIIALDRRKENYKKGPLGEEKGWNISRVPTLILLKNGKEVNRIVEQPIESWEEDLMAILHKMAYKPNYSN